MTFYGNLAKVCLRLVAQYGRPNTIQFATDGAIPDADKPWDPATPSYTTYEMPGVVTPVESEYVDHTIILQTDEQAIAAAQGMPSVPDNKCLYYDGPNSSGTLYKVTKVESIGPGTVPLAYIIFLRR